eukprot:6780162-Alexandrium_andersonii.AAC.1
MCSCALFCGDALWYCRARTFQQFNRAHALQRVRDGVGYPDSRLSWFSCGHPCAMPESLVALPNPAMLQVPYLDGHNAALR